MQLNRQKYWSLVKNKFHYNLKLQISKSSKHSMSLMYYSLVFFQILDFFSILCIQAILTQSFTHAQTHEEAEFVHPAPVERRGNEWLGQITCIKNICVEQTLTDFFLYAIFHLYNAHNENGNHCKMSVQRVRMCEQFWLMVSQAMIPGT